MTHTLISIVIPVYRVSKYLKVCLTSLINQRFDFKYNIILIDSNSDDGSDKICEEYERKYPSLVFHFHYKVYLTISESRNLGILHSNGKYITFIDGDDKVNDDYLSSLYSQMIKDERTDIVIANHLIVDKKGKLKRDRFKTKRKELNGIDMIKELFNQKRYQGYCWGKLYKRELLLKEHIFFIPNISMFEDFIFVVSALLKSNRVAFVKKESYLYIQHASSTLHINKDLMSYYLNAISVIEGNLNVQNKEKLLSILNTRKKKVIKDLENR